jgi:glutamine synthetase
MGGGDGPYGMTSDGESFIGGILKRLPALLAIGAPSVASYLRLIPSSWAGPFACWGLENREAALRFITAGSPNLEVKCFDGSANAYLVMAALLVAGAAGITEGARLPDPINVDPSTLDDVPMLPNALDQSLTALLAEPTLLAAFGEELVEAISTVRKGEIALFDGAAPQEVAERSRWRY